MISVVATSYLLGVSTRRMEGGRRGSIGPSRAKLPHISGLLG
jgi:hypothetical protein